MILNRWRSLLRFLLGLVLIGALTLPAGRAHGETAMWPFFAFDNGVGRGQLNPDQQAEILAELGYDGLGYTGTQNIPATLRALESHGLKMFSTYIRVDLTSDAAAYEDGLPAAIQQLAGHGTILWLHIHGDRATDLDDQAIRVIGEIADMAKDAKLQVVLYPHTGFYVATLADAVRLVKKIDRDNVGASFNLCHYLKQNDERDLAAQLASALPHLRLVSLNGADSGATRQMSWDRLIQTLDQGSFDVTSLLSRLRTLGYQGPIGLQCYGIRGDVRQNLDRSMAAWKRMAGDP